MLKARFVSSAQTGLETALLTGRPHRDMGSRQRLRMSITGSSSICRLKDCPVVVDLHELSPVGGWPAGRRHGRRRCRTRAKPSWPSPACESPLRSEPAPAGGGLVIRPWLGDERDQPDVATTPRARKRKLLPHPCHQFGLWRREVSWERGLPHESQPSPVACPPTACPPVAASRRLPTFPFVMRRDGGPELVIRGEHPWLVSNRRALPVLPRRRDQIREPVEELKR